MVAEGSKQTGRLLTFRVGSGRFAVFLEDVLGVQEPADCSGSSDCTQVFHGSAVAAVDVRVLWGNCSGLAAAMTTPAVIVVRSGGGPVALMVDSVEGIVEGVEMRPLPALVAPFVKDAFRGVALHANGSCLVVDPAALSGAAAMGGQRGPGEA